MLHFPCAKHLFTMLPISKPMTDVVRNVAGYSYDAEDWMSSETNHFDTHSYSHNNVNNRFDIFNHNGRAIHYLIDNLNRVVAEEWINSLNPQKFTYSYDKNSNVLSADDGKIKYEYSYEERDLLAEVDQLTAGQSTVSFVHKYDDVRNLTETKELVGGVLTATTSYEYADPRYYNTRVSQSGVGLANKRVDFVYSADTGVLENIDRYLGNQLIVRSINSYDDFGRLTGIVHQNSTGVISTHGYDYDALNRLTAERRDGVSRSFAYSKIDEVKSVSGSNTESYDYDKNGNRTNAGYQHTQQNRLVSDGVYSYDYDGEGNRIKRTEIATGKVDEYIWDYRNRLTSVISKDIHGVVTQTVSYEYDVNNLRVSKDVNGSVEKYFLDGDNIAFVTDGNGKQTFHYLYGMEADQVLAQDSETGMVWSLADRLGSIDVLVNQQGMIVDQRTYDSFGNTLSQLDPNVKFRFGYTGRESDPESGLYYYRARYFDANVGRFISTDPIDFKAGDANLYRYVFNNSTTHTDPSGMIAPLLLWDGLAFAGAIAGFATDYAIQSARKADNPDYQYNVGGAVFSTVTGAVIAPLAFAAASVSASAAIFVTAVGATSSVMTLGQAQMLSDQKNGNEKRVLQILSVFGIVTSFMGIGGGKTPTFGGSSAVTTTTAVDAAAVATSGTIGSGLLGSNIGTKVEDLFKPYFATDNGGDSPNEDNVVVPPGKGGYGTASDIGDLSGVSRNDAHNLLELNGAKYKPGSKYDT